MSPEDWKNIEERWGRPYDVIEMDADGFKLSIEPKMSKMRLVRMVYVNGWIKGIWLNPEHEECRRFYRVKESFIYSKKYRDELEKTYGKREYKKRKDKYEQKIKSYYPWWTYFRSFKRHLTANNKEIKLIK